MTEVITDILDPQEPTFTFSVGPTLAQARALFCCLFAMAVAAPRHRYVF